MEEIKNMTNNELGEIVKAFTECGKHKDCVSCPCEGVLCGINQLVEARESFMREVSKRLMEKK